MYQLTNSGAVVRLIDGANIPNEPKNLDWITYCHWLDAGNKPMAAPAPSDYEVISKAKEERARRVAAIVVITESGRAFDGDEISQSRMARAILGLQSQAEGATVRWVLHDNTVVDVGIVEMVEALTMSGLRQTELWIQR